METRKRRFGDRADGWLLRGADPMFGLIPHIMKKRTESQVHITMEFDIGETEKFLREKRKSEYPGLSYTHLFWAACVRGFAGNPKANRFVAGCRVYARRYIRLSMAIKESLSEEGKEFQVVADFDPNATLYEVARQIDDKIAEVREAETASNSTDELMNKLIMAPRPILSIVEKGIRALDYFGKLPKSFAETTPFFSSAYINNMGSLGAASVYHHLYSLGTTSMFLSIGKKERRYELDRNGNANLKQFMAVRIVVDERICDGFNYAMGFEILRKAVEHPETLMSPPAKVVEDNEIDKRK